jgi:hypothetical protein
MMMTKYEVFIALTADNPDTVVSPINISNMSSAILKVLHYRFQVKGINSTVSNFNRHLRGATQTSQGNSLQKQ